MENLLLWLAVFAFISKLLQGDKNMAAFCVGCFVLEVSTVGIFENKICIASTITSASQEKENKMLCIAMKKWEELQLIHDNAKSEEGQGYHYNKTQKLFKAIRVSVFECEFLTLELVKKCSLSESSRKQKRKKVYSMLTEGTFSRSEGSSKI